jgi:hypothetical protein
MALAMDSRHPVAKERPIAATVQRRHLAFWRQEETDRPLVGVYLGGYLLPDIYRVAQEGERLDPEQLTPEPFLDLLLQRCEALQRLEQDLVRPLEPPASVPWLEGMLGCPIRVHAQSVWAEPLLGEGEALSSFEPGWSDAWAEAAERFVRALVKRFAPHFPVAGPFLRGPADVLAAMIGTERLCYAFRDQPHEVHRLAKICAEAWIKVSRQISASIPSWHGGYVMGGRWVCAPEPCTYSSEDITAIFSPDTYREFFLPYNQLMAEQFSFGFLHRHSVSWQHFTTLLDLPPGWAVEVTMDPTGPGVTEILPVLRQLQKKERLLIVFGLNDETEVNRLVTGLSPRGLCVIVQADTEEQAQALLAVAKGDLGSSGTL